MQRFVCFILRMSIVMSGVLALLIGWHTLTRASLGAPILLVIDNSASNKFGPYLGEILRAEGLNDFDEVQLSSLTASDLTNHNLTILAETSLTPGQASLFSNYINNQGGRLLAMRPDDDLAATLGVTKVATTTGGYLAINPAVPANAGFTTLTLPYHGLADAYNLAGGAIALATLYSDQTTSTGYPAVVRYGNTVTWSYDLARSVIYSRQGNPANAGVDQDGLPPLRTNDVFYNAIDLDRVSTPHADIQMRLFSRLITELLADQTPLPRLWYFPDNHRTMLVVTADEHGPNPLHFTQLITAVESYGGHISLYLSRYGSYPTDSVANDWRLRGHELGMHPYGFADENQTLDEGFIASENYFLNQGYGTPSRTARYHMVEWAGWVDAAEVDADHNIGLDTNFYTWGPGLWYNGDRFNQAHGYITGSALPMQFIDEQGNIIPVYQQVTSLVDEQLVWGGYSQELTPAAAVAVSQQLIDASEAGDYAAIMTQFHVDYYPFGEVKPWVDGTLAYAQSLNIPIWTAEHWLNFTETRHDANYSDIAWNDPTKTLTFNLTSPTTSGISLTTVLPLTYDGNSLQEISVDTQPISHTAETITGVEVAFVPVPAGDHSFVAQYHNDGPPPTLSIDDITVTEGQTGSVAAAFTVSLSEASGQPITVTYVTANGSATAPADYLTAGGALAFTPGVVTQLLTITIMGDALVEGNETFQVALTNPINADFGNSQGEGTITDDDSDPSQQKLFLPVIVK